MVGGTISQISNSRRICLSLWMAIVAIACALSAMAEEPAAPPRLDAYGDPLPLGVISRLGTIRFRVQDPIKDAVFSPNGKLLACVGIRGGMSVLTTTTGTVVLDSYADTFNTRVAFSGDNRLLASCDDAFGVHVWNIDKRAIVWDTVVPSRRVKRRDRPERDSFESVSLSESGRFVTTVTREGDLDVWETSRRNVAPVYSQRVARIAVIPLFAPDERTVIIGSRIDDLVRVVDLRTGQVAGQFPTKAGSTICLGVSPDSESLTGVGKGDPLIPGSSFPGGSLRVWALPLGTERWKVELGNRNEAVTDVRYSEDGKTVLTGQAVGGKWQRWKSDTGRSDGTFDPAIPREAIAVSPDYKSYALSPGPRLSLVLRSAPDGAGQAFPDRPASGVATALCFSPDGHHIATGSWDDSFVRAWDVRTGSQLWARRCAGYSVAYSPDGGFVAVGEDKGAIRLLDMAEGKTTGKLRDTDADDEVTGEAFSTDGSKLAALAGDHAMLWDVRDRKRLWRISIPGVESGMAFIDRVKHPGRKSIAYCSQRLRVVIAPPGGGLQVFSEADGSRVASFESALMESVTVSEDCKSLFATTDRDNFRWTDPDLTDRTKTRNEPWWQGHKRQLSKNGALVVACTEDGHIVVRDFNSGEVLCSWVYPYGARMVTATFSPDNSLLATANADTSVLIWQVSTHSRLKK